MFQNVLGIKYIIIYLMLKLHMQIVHMYKLQKISSLGNQR